MAVASGATVRGLDVPRWFVPLAACCVVLLAGITDPGRWWEVGLLAVAAVMLTCWAWLDLPLTVVAPAVIAATTASQWSGQLESGLFLLSLLAIAITGWQDLRPSSCLLLLLTVAAPVMVMRLQGPEGISAGIWVLGILFPAAMGWAFHRQETLTAELERARMALAEQAVLEERRRIARDVHDLVGHGLAAMMLQITSARHVLHRDLGTVDEALVSAEDVGRRTLRELRRTVGILRDDSGAVAAPIEGLEQIAALVADARTSGLRAEYAPEGPQTHVGEAIGVTLYRIAQASLANAAIHAPAARTVVTSTVTGEHATLEVLSIGPLRPHNGGESRGHYGLRGMRERAEVVDAEFSAGPVPEGWLVRCRVAR